MKNNKILVITVAFVILSTFTACTKQEDNRTVIKEPDKSITVIDNEDKKHEEPSISVKKIYEPLNVVEISDWLDEQNMVVVMENKELEKMSLLENSEQYSRGIYLYNLDTKEVQPLKVRENMFLGGATLSPDKKHLLYYEYSVGDTAYYVIDMNDNEEKDIKDEVIGLAMTAEWTNDNEIIGASYAGGAYTADTSVIQTPIDNLQDEQLYTVVKTQSKIYSITIADTLDMYVLDINTNIKKKLKVENADGIIPSQDGEQILITQSTESGRKLLVADSEGNILRTIAEGTEITGASWSPDQMMIAYQLKTVENGADISGLYIYDVLAGTSTQIAVNITTARINWSPSGDKIAVTQYYEGYNSNCILYLSENEAIPTKDMGYITAIDTQNKTISVDRTELLFEKDEERLAELGMTTEDLVTGFIIHNEDDKIELLTYGDDLSIELLDGTLQLESDIEDLESVLNDYKILANLTIIDNVVVKISEQYLP